MSGPRSRRLLALAFAVALALTVFFAVKALHHAGTIGPAADAPIEGWMTPRYVSLSWDVPRELIAEALDVDLGGGSRPRSLAALAEERGMPVETLVDDLETAIAAYRDRAR